MPLTLVDFDYLITKKKVEEDDVFADLVNPNSEVKTFTHGDANMRTLVKGEILQLERKGYFIVDEPFVSESSPVVLFLIPDGRTRSWGVSVAGPGK